MFYEGTEKRLEITVAEHDLLLLPESFWQRMVSQAGACILSKIENSHLSAYLLSESSLFVWKNSLLMITCGNTHLVKAAQFFQKEMTKDNIQSLLFHRHQPLQPESQISNFKQDSIQLNAQLQGVTQHWQGKYQGDLFLFGNISSDYSHKQILMLHGLTGSFAKKLQQGTACTGQIELKLALEKFFPQLIIDQFTFTPKGYSLNAITGRDYLTIHITPEKLSAYLSLESSFNEDNLAPFMKHLVCLFSPLQGNSMSLKRGAQANLEISLSDPLLV